MTEAYSDPAREADPHALPDIEVFYRSSRDNFDDCWLDENGDSIAAGWYWWTCFPGCLPDSEPVGPFDTETEALASAQED